MNIFIAIIVKSERNMAVFIFDFYFVFKVSKGAKIRNRYSQVSHLTQYKWESGKLTVIHHKREQRGQPVPSR